MTVKELIEKLMDYPKDYEVCVKYRDSGGEYDGVDKDLYLAVGNKKIVL